MKKVSHSDRRNAPPEEQLVLEADDVVVPERKATAAQLERVRTVARQQIKLTREIARDTEALKKKERELQTNKTDELPKALEAANLADGTPLGGGASVAVETKVRASIPSLKAKVDNAEEKNAAGIAYMRRMAPDLIETTLTLRFPVGEEKELQRLLAQNARRKNPLEFEFAEVVNTARLKSWVEKRDEQGLATDADALNIQRFKIAEVVLPKVKKKSDI